MINFINFLTGNLFVFADNYTMVHDVAGCVLTLALADR